MTASTAAWSILGMIEAWADGFYTIRGEEVVAFNLAALAAYALFGVLLGVTLQRIIAPRAWWQRLDPGDQYATAVHLAALVTIAIVGTHALTSPGLGAISSLSLTVISATVAVAALAGIVFRRTRRLALVLSNPWSVAFLMIGPIWLVRDGFVTMGDAEKRRAAAVLIVVVVVVAAVFTWRRPRRAMAIGVGAAFLLTVAGAVAAEIRRDLPAVSHMTSRGKPNVVLIVMDTVRADHTSLLGYERNTTPVVAMLPGTRYLRAFATSNVTLSSHGSMFTGLYATAHGAHEAKRRPGAALSTSFRTVAEVLGARGYETLAVVANTGYLSRKFQLDQGFDLYDVRSSRAYLLRRTIARFAARPRRLPYRSADQINSAVGSLLRRPRREPFFLFINYMDAHWPYNHDPKTALRYGLEGDFSPPGAEGESLTEKERHALIAQYDASIATVDRAIGEIVDTLDRVGELDDTLLIITSDHGEAFGEHGVFGHGRTIYDHQTHVPLLVRHPRETTRQTSSRPVSLTSLFSTIVAAAGIDRNAPGVAPRFSESLPPFAEAFTPYQAAVVEGPWKLIQSSNRSELYNLDLDHQERNDLADEARHQTVLDRLRRLVVALKPKPFDGRTVTPIDEETLRQLRALGYLK